MVSAAAKSLIRRVAAMIGSNSIKSRINEHPKFMNMDKNETVSNIVTSYLVVNGFDGLVDTNDFECGCSLEDLIPCDNMQISCFPGKKVPCSGEDACEYHNDGCKFHIELAESGGVSIRDMVKTYIDHHTVFDGLCEYSCAVGCAANADFMPADCEEIHNCTVGVLIPCNKDMCENDGEGGYNDPNDYCSGHIIEWNARKEWLT